MSFYKKEGTTRTKTVDITYKDGDQELTCRAEILVDDYFTRKKRDQELDNSKRVVKLMTPEYAETLKKRTAELEKPGITAEEKKAIEEKYALSWVGKVDAGGLIEANTSLADNPDWIKKNLIDHVQRFFSPPTDEFPQGEEENFAEVLDYLPGELVEAIDLKVKELNKIGKRFTAVEQKNL